MSAKRVEHVIFDVDDVLLEMEHPTRLAERAVLVPLSARFGEAKAREVHEGLSKGYGTLIRHLRLPPDAPDEPYVELRRRIDTWQSGLPAAGHEVKPWSRDTLLAIALEDAGLRPTGELVSSTLAHYWSTLASQTRIYPDARELLTCLRARGVSYHLATNSDGFLRLDDAAQTFVYDPADSAARKVRRLSALTGFGVAVSSITVGDPIGKPRPAYYERVLAEFGAQVGRPLDLDRTLAIGDSLTSDVLPFRALGVAHGVWLDRSRTAQHSEVGPQGVQVVASLDTVRQWF